MEFKDIATIAGKPGLFRVVKPTRTGIIIEPIGEKGPKRVVNSHQRVSILKEISIYTTTEEESVQLLDVFLSIKEKYEGELDVDVSSGEACHEFMEAVLPEYDKARVYPNSIKKIVKWYNVLLAACPEVIVPEPEEEEKKTEEGEKED